MSPKANRITLCDATTRQLTLAMRLYHHFSIQYEFCAAAQRQSIIKPESASFSWNKCCMDICGDFSSSGTRVAWGRKNYPGNKLNYPGTRLVPTAALVTTRPLQLAPVSTYQVSN